MPPISRVPSQCADSWNQDEWREGFVEVVESSVNGSRPARPFFLPIGGDVPLEKEVPPPYDYLGFDDTSSEPVKDQPELIEDAVTDCGYISRQVKNRKGAGGRLHRKVRVKCERPWEV